MNQRRRRFLGGVVAVAAGPVIALGAAPAAFSTSSHGPVPVPDGAFSDTYETPVPLGVAQGLKKAEGTVEVSVRLAAPSVAEVVPEGAVAESTVPSRAAQRGTTAKVEAQQKGFVNSARKLGAKELGSTQLAANLVVLEVDASQLEAIASLDDVVSVNPLNRYEKHEGEAPSGSLAQAIDYVDARGLHDAGFTGEGVRVAVLDSGIDYTHYNLGGPGDQAVTDTCMAGADAPATGECADLFGPDAPKVKGGFDFVGDTWPNGALAPDPNPIDSGPAGGHGTHVGDIIGGHSADGLHQGIAPGTSLYAVKVCSAVSTSCSGVAMLQGLDWALDPNGDGDISDAVDIVNMSLGSSYGQDEDDSSFASDNLVRAGVVVVASAGNDADRPFIVGSPSSAEGVISVAQTALPDDRQWVIESSTGLDISNAVHQSWSPTLSGSGLAATPLVRPTDAGGIGCSQGAFTADTAGKVALIQRGSCNVSDKALFAQKAGAVAAIIFNNVPGDPPTFSFGSAEPVTIPTFTISQSHGQALVSAMAGGTVTVTIDPAAAISLTNSTVGTSSRGVTVDGHRAKPDIGAPGAWLSAETGTATEETGFGGTSGAAPVVTGVAALLIDKFEDATPSTIKARLLNGADSTNRTPVPDGFITTPVSRVGAGEVRAAAAADAAGVLSVTGIGGNVGLGIPSVTKQSRHQVELTLTNSSDQRRIYHLAAEFRDAADAESGAVGLHFAPKQVTVQPGATRTVKVQVTIDGPRLDAWPFDWAGSIGSGAALNGPEFDGWITATSGDEQLHLGWTVLPRKAADVSTAGSVTLDTEGQGSLTLRNASTVATGSSEVFALTGTSPELPEPGAGGPGTPGSNQAVIDLAATGVRVDLDHGVAEFAVATYDRRTVLPYPAEFDIYVDADNDGTDDYVLYTAELGGFASTGQTVVYVFDLASGVAVPHYYAGAGFDSSTMILTAPLGALGIDEGQTFSFSVYAFDNYFTGWLTDYIEGQVFTAGEQLYAADPYVEVDAKGRANLDVTATGATGESTQSGLLLLHQSAAQDDFSVVTVRR
ncbi:MAG: hypothetical protein DCC50_00155 [Acidobacteria bacterium]|nr:MAG: hypothetical protein DCC50_00155 [Acidobacteriota bacterium]